MIRVCWPGGPASTARPLANRASQTLPMAPPRICAGKGRIAPSGRAAAAVRAAVCVSVSFIGNLQRIAGQMAGSLEEGSQSRACGWNLLARDQLLAHRRITHALSAQRCKHLIKRLAMRLIPLPQSRRSIFGNGLRQADCALKPLRLRPASNPRDRLRVQVPPSGLSNRRIVSDREALELKY